VKTTITAFFAAALIAAAPSVLAQGVASTTGQLHKTSKQHHRAFSGYTPLHEMQARSLRNGYVGAFGYAPAEPRGLNRDLEASRQAGGGGGGGGGM
jgi:hypothetical protein